MVLLLWFWGITEHVPKYIPANPETCLQGSLRETAVVSYTSKRSRSLDCCNSDTKDCRSVPSCHSFKMYYSC